MEIKQYQTVYNKWMTEPTVDEDTKKILAQMDPESEQVYDAFYKDLAFGTAGLRGIMGPGTNRMNQVVIRRVTKGVSNYLKRKYNAPTVAISYDSRQNSRAFAETAASVLVSKGIKVWMFSQIMPVPALSFVTRFLKCQLGIMITASHNAKEYNGYKVFGDDGGQILAQAADEILAEIEQVSYFDDSHIISFEEALQKGCQYISKEVEESYYGAIHQLSLGESLADLSVVYTPLNGAGLEPVTRVLTDAGLNSFHVVSEQENPDGTFPTCPNPNPELPEVYDLAMKLCDKVRGDVILATDPDSDRIGLAVASQESQEDPTGHLKNGYRVFTGNEIASLLLDFILKKKTLPKDSILVRTIVSTPLVDEMIKTVGGEVKTTLIGFKYIGAILSDLQTGGQENRFVFGFEEGNGFLENPYVRDKDAVGTALLLCQMAAHYKRTGKTLVQRLNEIYREHGYYRERVLSFVFEGADGVSTMQAIMERFRENQREPFMGSKAKKIVDYLEGFTHYLGGEEGCDMSVGRKPTGLPKENIMEFAYPNHSSFIVRPSGTEPKLKIYLFVKSDQAKTAESQLSQLEKEVRALVEEGEQHVERF